MTDTTHTIEIDRPNLPLTCPFDDCDWSSQPMGDGARISHDHAARSHYEREHAGRVKIRVTLEREQLLGDRDPVEIADRAHDYMAEGDAPPGWDVAYTSAEVLDAADPHPSRDDADDVQEGDQ